MTASHKTTILVIEDEADIRRFACRALDLEGYGVIEAGDGDSGLRLMKNDAVSLVLLDLRLPGRDGWAVIAAMKKDPRLSGIPVVVFSASAGDAHRERAVSAGASDYLVKPLDVNRLRRTVAKVLRTGGAIAAWPAEKR